MNMFTETFFDLSLHSVFIILINSIFYGFLIYLVVRLLKALWKRKK